MPFRDRTDAGRRLAAALSRYKGHKPLILALPRGGVPVAVEIASALDGALDLMLVRKIGVPVQPELAMGAVAEGTPPFVVRNEEVIAFSGVTPQEFEAACQHEVAEIERRRRQYIGDRAREPVAGRVVIVVDDGIATGATVKAALQAIRRQRPAKLVLAVPVAPPETIEALRPLVDEVVCLETPEPFGAIGYFYRDFSQLRDADVEAAMAGRADSK